LAGDFFIETFFFDFVGMKTSLPARKSGVGRSNTRDGDCIRAMA
jgi:hypothetical protein